MPAEIDIRVAGPKDLRETVLIYLECLRSDYACKPQAYLEVKTVEVELAECEQWLYGCGALNRIFVGTDEAVMAGYIAVGANAGPPPGYEGEVAGFFVRKAYRKRGIGLRLLKAGIAYLRDQGYHKVAIYNYHISEANSFYRRLGGEVVWQEIQRPGGMAFETDVFGYEIAALLSTLDRRLATFGLL